MSHATPDVDAIYAQDAKLKRADVKILQEWLKKQQHLPQLQEIHLILFLHSCYYRIEDAKKTIDNYYTRHTRYPHVFGYLNEDELRITCANTLNETEIIERRLFEFPSPFQNKHDIGAFFRSCLTLPKPTPEGYTIFLAKLVDLDPDNFNYTNCIRLASMVLSLTLYENGPSNGIITVFDTKGFTFSHLTKLNLAVLKHSADHLQYDLPLRLKGIHFLNAVPVLDKLFSLLKPFLLEKTSALIRVHHSFDTFYEYVPKECLPEEYGGHLLPCESYEEKNLENLLRHYDFFRWNDSMKVDESKRLDKSNNFGVDGTFKILEID